MIGLDSQQVLIEHGEMNVSIHSIRRYICGIIYINTIEYCRECVTFEVNDQHQHQTGKFHELFATDDLDENCESVRKCTEVSKRVNRVTSDTDIESTSFVDESAVAPSDLRSKINHDIQKR